MIAHSLKPKITSINMTSQDITKKSSQLGQNLLNVSAKLWFVVTLIGQLIFAFYIIAVYYSATFTLDFSKYKIMPAGYIEGDFWGNFAVIMHLIFAAIITLGGLTQLLPIIRRKIPALHRWNGRLYIVTAMIVSLSGAFMIITRYDLIVGTWVGHVTLMFSALVILTCASLAFKYARAKKFNIHRKWALRLFVAASGVWFFRIGLMAWLTLHGKPIGFDPVTFSGPFLTVLYTLVYVLPLAFLEVYLRAQSSTSNTQKLLAAMLAFVLILIQAVGTFGATMGMWLPRI
jgi:hypothetical protein